MKVSRRVLARHIASELQPGKDRQRVIQSLAAYIVEHRLQSSIDLILADIDRNLARHGIVQAHVSSARPLSSSLLDSVIDYVKRLESVSSVEINEHIDPTLLGGIVIETPAHRYDASISTKLKRLRNA